VGLLFGDRRSGSMFPFERWGVGSMGFGGPPRPRAAQKVGQMSRVETGHFGRLKGWRAAKDH